MAKLAAGHGYWMGAGQALEVHPGEIIVIPPDANGILRASQMGGACVRFFSWNPELLMGVLTLSEQRYFSTAAQRGNSPVRIIRLQDAGAFDANPEDLSLANRSRLLQLIGQVFATEMNRCASPAIKTVSAAERFEEMIRQLTDSELLNFTPAQLSRQCGCSMRHFGRLFSHHLGTSVRAHQTRLRLQKAGLLLANGNTKVIEVALESGYHNLSLFNKMFKKHTGMTPTQWRQRHADAPESRPSKNAKSALLAVGLLLSFGLAAASAAETRTPSPSTPPAATNASVTTTAATSTNTFKIEGYRVEGNTVLDPWIIKKTLAPYVGDAMTFAQITKGVTELRLAYRQMGFVTCTVTLPQQSISNGIVRLDVIESPLADVSVTGNKWYSTSNILAALPSARTNALLNSLAFQQELALANANRDRQIYPEVAPGPEPGTTALRLKVVDQLPLHASYEVNNQSTPGTPDIRMNGGLLYNNFWQKNHQGGLQYNFTPGQFKDANPHIENALDKPQVVSYSGFYRMPLDMGKTDTYKPLHSSDFGYDEATRRFRPPPPSEGSPELVLYASRSVSDTGRTIQSSYLPNGTVDQVKQNAATSTNASSLFVEQTTYSQSLTFNNNIGLKINQPLKTTLFDSTLTYGIDYKTYHSYNSQIMDVNAAVYTEVDTNLPWSDSANWLVNSPGTQHMSSRTTATKVEYCPLTLNWDGARRDASGVTTFNFDNTLNFLAFSPSPWYRFAQVRQSAKSTGDFYILNAGMSRDQMLPGDWSVFVKANGQWASQPVIGNEQFGLGGLGGPRGYREGEEYGDAGWRVTLEPRTPALNVGMVDGTMPMRLRFSVFTDYAQRFNYVKQLTLPDGTYLGDGGKPTVDMWGAGAGFNGTIGNHMDFRFTLAYPLLKAGGVTPGTVRLYFGISMQF